MSVVAAPAETGCGCWGAGCREVSAQAILGVGASGMWQVAQGLDMDEECQLVLLGPGCRLTLGWACQASPSFLPGAW